MLAARPQAAGRARRWDAEPRSAPLASPECSDSGTPPDPPTRSPPLAAPNRALLEDAIAVAPSPVHERRLLGEDVSAPTKEAHRRKLRPVRPLTPSHVAAARSGRTSSSIRVLREATPDRERDPGSPGAHADSETELDPLGRADLAQHLNQTIRTVKEVDRAPRLLTSPPAFDACRTSYSASGRRRGAAGQLVWQGATAKRQFVDCALFVVA
jgi:hypothetical protein